MKTIRIIKVLFAKKGYVGNSMSEAEIKLWYRHFKYGRKSIESDLRSAMLSRTRTLENVERVRIVIKENLTTDRARIRKKHMEPTVSPAILNISPAISSRLVQGSFWQIIALLSTLSTLALCHFRLF